MFVTIAFAALALVGSPSILHAGSAPATAQTVEVHAHRYNFSPAEITIKKGETVTIKLYSDDVPHSLVIKELGISKEVTKNHPEDVTVTPQKTGDFRGKCGRFCGSGHGSMSFTVHVQE
jgi:cytochrome c oxidase subunit 2